MKKMNSFVLLLLLICLANCLHLQPINLNHMAVEDQLIKLRQQQSSLEKQVNGLITNISFIQTQIDSANNTNDKVIILENAILSERQKIFQIQNQIIPPFNLSKNACQQLTNKQKINLLDQVTKAKAQIAKLKEIASKIPACDEITMINSDIQKQIILIESIERIIYTNCNATIVLSPSIFQTNVYASNWILGNQTIDDLIQQYYQRSIQYHNVTNCPDQFPFFDGKQCINCTGTSPIFNMLTKKCDSCPDGASVNTDLRVCRAADRYTNYSSVSNYALDGATLPAADTTKLACPSQTPYFNGSCVACAYPKYWSVKTNVCKSCPVSTEFDSNTQSCSKTTVAFTNLNSTNWVTSDGNLTKVLQARKQYILQNNITSIVYCEPETPYFDGIQCISCEFQFNMDTNKCTFAPAGTQYNKNTHNYVVPELNKQTNSKAANIISKSLLVDNPNIQNCNDTNPYYDGISCIACQAPFILFDNDQKKCVICDSTQKYNSTTFKCDDKQKLYISTNFNNLMATPAKTVDAYQTQIINKLNSSNDKVIVECQSTDYSDNTKCFPCPSPLVFNVQTKKCDNCNGTLDPNTNLCIAKSTLITDLKTAPNLLASTSKPIDTYAQVQKAIVGPVQTCSAAKPYAVSGLNCISCANPTYYFDLATQKCTSCPSNTVYNSTSKLCEQIPAAPVCAANQVYNETLKKCIALPLPANANYYPNLTNYNWTVNSYNGIDKVYNLTKTRKASNQSQPCPAGKEYFNNNTLSCQSCPVNNYFNYDNWACQSCPTGQQLDINTHKCGKRTNNTYQTNVLNSSLTNMLYNNLPKQQYIDYYNGNKTTSSTIQDCPGQTPFFDGFECINCHPTTPYFNLYYQKCMSCDSPAIYNSQKKDCQNNGNVITSPPNDAKRFSSIF